MHHGFWRPASIILLLAGLLAACGAPEDLQSNDQSPSRADLIARLQSPTESEELRSFRIRSEMSFSGQLPTPGDVTGDVAAGVMSMRADVRTDPAALQMTTVIADGADAAESITSQTIVIEDQLWLNLGDGWHQEEAFASDLTAWFLDSFTQFTNPFASFAESPATSDLLAEAEIAGVEEVNGYRTTHFRLTTEALIAMMMEAYDGSAAVGPACEDLEEPADGPRDLDDGEAMADFFACMGAAVAGELPAPEEYIERYEVDVWVSDEGFVMREQTVMEFAFLPLAAAFTSTSGDESSLAMTMSFDLYDLNADLVIEPPEAD